MCHHDEGTVLVGGFAAAAVQVWVKHGPDPPLPTGFCIPPGPDMGAAPLGGGDAFLPGSRFPH